MQTTINRMINILNTYKLIVALVSKLLNILYDWSGQLSMPSDSRVVVLPEHRFGDINNGLVYTNRSCGC